MKGALCVSIRLFDTDFLFILHLQLIYWKRQFWWRTGVGHLHAFLSPAVWFFYGPPGPNVGHLQLFKSKKKKERKVQQMPKGGSRIGMLAIDWAIIELHNDQSNSTCKNWSENISIQRRFWERRQTPCFYILHFSRLFLYQETWKSDYFKSFLIPR